MSMDLWVPDYPKDLTQKIQGIYRPFLYLIDNGIRNQVQPV